MGVPVAAGATEPDPDSDDGDTTAQAARAAAHSTAVAAATLHGLRSTKASSDAARPPLLLNPWPSGEEAAPQPVARTLPASTLDVLLSGLPHYHSRLDEQPRCVQLFAI
jgi:hypothetical protein